MFIIYPWIKIKLKVLLFSTIQKPYCSHFSFISGFVDALKTSPFTGEDFKRWQMWVTLWLIAINVFWVSEGKPEGGLIPEKEKAYSEVNTIFCGAVVGVHTETFVVLKRCVIPWTLNMEFQMLAPKCTSLSSNTTNMW
jgi:hypothetical protein